MLGVVRRSVINTPSGILYKTNIRGLQLILIPVNGVLKLNSSTFISWVIKFFFYLITTIMYYKTIK